MAVWNSRIAIKLLNKLKLNGRHNIFALYLSPFLYAALHLTPCLLELKCVCCSALVIAIDFWQLWFTFSLKPGCTDTLNFGTTPAVCIIMCIDVRIIRKIMRLLLWHPICTFELHCRKMWKSTSVGAAAVYVTHCVLASHAFGMQHVIILWTYNSFSFSHSQCRLIRAKRTISTCDIHR